MPHVMAPPLLGWKEGGLNTDQLKHHPIEFYYRLHHGRIKIDKSRD
jgi:hypothetical protein